MRLADVQAGQAPEPPDVPMSTPDAPTRWDSTRTHNLPLRRVPWPTRTGTAATRSGIDTACPARSDRLGTPVPPAARTYSGPANSLLAPRPPEQPPDPRWPAIPRRPVRVQCRAAAAPARRELGRGRHPVRWPAPIRMLGRLPLPSDAAPAPGGRRPGNQATVGASVRVALRRWPVPSSAKAPAPTARLAAAP